MRCWQHPTLLASIACNRHSLPLHIHVHHWTLCAMRIASSHVVIIVFVVAMITGVVAVAVAVSRAFGAAAAAIW